jgi:hypothetical protein
MTAIETGVLNPITINETENDDLFNLYCYAFSGRSTTYSDGRIAYAADDYDRGFENRRSDSKDFALEQKQSQRFSQASRFSMAPCWADSRATARDRFRDIVTLSKTVQAYAGQTVLRFVQGSPASIDPETESTPDFRIEVARIMPETGLAHLLYRLPDNERPAGFARVPFAQFNMVIPVMNSHQVLTSDNGVISHQIKQNVDDPDLHASIRSRKEPVPLLLARHGIVSLSPEKAIYDATRREMQETLLFGDDEANDFFKKLVTIDTEIEDQYREELGSDGRLFDMSRRFPDLSWFIRKPLGIEAALAENEALMSQLSNL